MRTSCIYTDNMGILNGLHRDYEKLSGAKAQGTDNVRDTDVRFYVK